MIVLALRQQQTGTHVFHGCKYCPCIGARLLPALQRPARSQLLAALASICNAMCALVGSVCCTHPADGVPVHVVHEEAAQGVAHRSRATLDPMVVWYVYVSLAPPPQVACTLL